MSNIQISMTINGIEHSAMVESRMLLIDFLRKHCALTGTHEGCDTTQCGCCTVLVNEQSVKSCTVLAAQVDGASVTTIEGIGSPRALHPLQESFQRHHALQCGFCTPGMVMQGLHIIAQGRGTDQETVREDLGGNLCRCTGYQNIVDAIVDCARNSQSHSPPRGS